jgi:hypothetical protein
MSAGPDPINIRVVDVEELAVDMTRAHQLLGFGADSRWLDDPRCPVPRCDLRKPGDSKPVWRWRVKALEAFLAAREIAPGQVNPQGAQYFA